LASSKPTQSDDLAVLKAGRAVIFLNAAGTASQKKGAYAEAEGHFKNALSIIEKVWGPDNANVGVTLNNLALLYKEQGRFDDAENVYKRSLEILEKAAGPNQSRGGQYP
jgi:tetratricopeptide (TPR) repeat protein